MPNKVKNLVWHACTNSLPTKVNLVRRKIISDGLCDICRLHQEDTNHALYCCPMLNPLWSQTPIWVHDTLKGSKTFTDIMDFVFAGNKEPELFSLVVWNLWNRCNNLRLGKTALPLDKIIEHVRDWRFEALAPPVIPSLHRGQRQVAWSPLEAPRYKINYDATTFAEDGKAGLGVVIRNSEGLVMASLTQQIPLPATVIETKALAARRATEFALEIGLANIILEGDNETLFKALKNGDNSLAQHGHIIKDILFLSSYC